MTDAFNIFQSTGGSSEGNNYSHVNNGQSNNEDAMAKQSGFKKRIIVRKGNAYIPLGINSIAVFYHYKITFAIDFSGNKYIVEENLYNLEKMVDALMFFRVNRQIILNIEAIKEFRTIEHGKIIIQLLSPDWIKEDVYVSQITAPLFKQWIAKL
jgi:DNA-binding LytR/AlgR family response regulator